MGGPCWGLAFALKNRRVSSSAARMTSQALALAFLLLTRELPASTAPAGLPCTRVHVGDTCAQGECLQDSPASLLFACLSLVYSLSPPQP